MPVPSGIGFSSDKPLMTDTPCPACAQLMSG
nr:MAG TPA_asm: hypothetical protein [Caudoviricetes sp.]